MSRHVRKGDMVEVISGDLKGERGKILRVMPDEERVVVEGVNMVYRHVRPNRRNPQGGRIQKEAPVHISNVLPIDPKTNRGSRVRFQVDRDKTGKIVAKKRVTIGGAVLGDVTRAQGD